MLNSFKFSALLAALTGLHAAVPARQSQYTRQSIGRNRTAGKRGLPGNKLARKALEGKIGIR